ncbi:MAG: CDP-diacylglycerol--glycerol-3-phosphate 3-phosphatidyltransferase [Bdellovibrionales bacterium RIFOXYD1_FULL_53_11]|nr:MAG: CDP-diacylglycerol--glycerol-3-phosphate 3-phosphatidyltransferase [Bdellovibrionales bacterium RIFOXYD1_FULL_53_11]
MEENSSKRSKHDELTFNTTPNILTMIRMAMVPVIVGCLFARTRTWDFVAMIVFVAASLTDYFDGYIARSHKVITVYGKLLDPLADKFLVVSTLVMLQELGRIHPVIVILLICRELAITGLRALASAEGLIISASASAKLKTATQMVAIPLVILKDGIPGLPALPLFEIGVALIYISLAISLWSAKDYIIGFFRALKAKRKDKTLKRRLLKEERRKLRLERRTAKMQKRLEKKLAKKIAREARASRSSTPSTPPR